MHIFYFYKINIMIYQTQKCINFSLFTYIYQVISILLNNRDLLKNKEIQEIAKQIFIYHICVISDLIKAVDN